jgi:hypothetical protein
MRSARLGQAWRPCCGMDFSAWIKEAGADLRRVHGIDPARISEKVWRQLYVHNRPPSEAPNRAHVLYVNALPTAKRTRYRVARGK